MSWNFSVTIRSSPTSTPFPKGDWFSNTTHSARYVTTTAKHFRLTYTASIGVDRSSRPSPIFTPKEFSNDLSTRNILLSSDMNIKICDFGFATKRGESMRGMAETRYNRYRKGWDVSVVDDLFAIGCLFFEILTGKRPYDDVESIAIEQRFQDRVFPGLNGIDSDFARIIDKCWNERYSSVEEIQWDFPVEPEL